MKREVGVRAWWLALLLGVAWCGVAEAQKYTPPPPPLTTLPPCPQGAENIERAKKLAKEGECDPTNVPQPRLRPQPQEADPAAQAFPFPGDSKQTPAAQAFPFPGSGSDAGSGAASPTAGTTPNTPAAKQYPYPGADAGGPMPSEDGKPAPAASSPASSQGASPNASSGASPDASPSAGPAATPDKAKQPPLDDATDSSSSSSSSNNAAAADPDTQPKLIDKGSHGRKSHHGQSDSDRVDEDLSVAHFYLQSGNLMGSYLRAQDAVKTQPDYAPGHFALAEAAVKLGHRDEAQAEFKQYLKLEPDGEKAKAAEKELAKLD